MALNPMLKKLVSQTATKYKGGNSKLHKLKEGRNTIRVIAPGVWQTGVMAEGENPNFHRELGVHWIKPDMNAKPIAVVGSEEICYQRVSALAAAIDMAIANAYDEDSKKLYEEWKARKSVILSVVNRDAGDEVQTLELTPTTFGKLMDLATLYDDNDINIFDHVNGMDITITKTGKGLNTTYDVAVIPLAPGKSYRQVTDEQVRQAEDLDAFITANYFRGEEQKALNAVATIAGVKIPQLGAPATPVAALTSAAATVADAPAPTPAPAPAPTPAPEPTPAPAAAAPAQMTIEQMQAEIARQAALLAASQAQQAAAATPAPTPAPAAPAPAAVTPETSISDLDQSEQDALLAELNSIGA